MWPLITVRNSAGNPCQDATKHGQKRNRSITIITVITDSSNYSNASNANSLLCSLCCQLCCDVLGVCVKKKGFKINPEQIIGCFEFGAIFERAVYWLQLSRDFFDRFYWLAFSPFKKAITTNHARRNRRTWRRRRRARRGEA